MYGAALAIEADRAVTALGRRGPRQPAEEVPQRPTKSSEASRCRFDVDSFRLSRNVTPGAPMRGEPEPMSKKTRRRFTPDQKAAIVRRHLVDRVPISDCATSIRFNRA